MNSKSLLKFNGDVDYLKRNCFIYSHEKTPTPPFAIYWIISSPST
ncbi:protein of unknown function [Candidatus Nitrosacidococcus tergens]|uniref:Uncharacterized protein n=1 Tax=Candidatus Nitrosacidococcus tergens TaxID=553981 RepID=A0A7G1QB98_9GAMM|nr:protein of unknown function [Candidatus Nitrosacidococcus tergens]